MRKRDNGHIIILDLEGELDLYTSADLKKVFDSLSKKDNINLLVNMKNVSYIDSTGVGVIVRAIRDMKNNGRNLKVIQMQPQVKRVFELSNILFLIDYYKDENSSVAGI
ncbi:MAG: STAS domain-containing protein [Spirochaetales bacterium]|nr:STAS domain-containing protein [Spirochaetales bacterium]